MDARAIRIVKALLKKGMLSRSENPTLWNDLEEPEVLQELEMLEQELEFDIYRAGSRVYLIPNQENELFSQDNLDFKRDTRAPAETRIIDLYLWNYLAIYLLYEFFHGEGMDPLTREFILRQDFIRQFTAHCEQVAAKAAPSEVKKYSIDFVRLAEVWLSKQEGEPDDKRIDTRMGCLSKVINKMKVEQLFLLEDEKIVPTQKCRDLMPYFLRRERVTKIHAFLKEGTEDAAAH